MEWKRTWKIEWALGSRANLWGCGFPEIRDPFLLGGFPTTSFRVYWGLYWALDWGLPYELEFRLEGFGA